MTTRRPRRTTLRTGRPLDDDGEATDGPALELDPEGPAATLFRQSPRPLASDPGGRTWATLLERPAEGSTDRPVVLQWLAPDASEPPEHVHPTAETFEGVEGEFTVVVEGEETRLGPGESVTVEPGREHTFRNDTDGVVAFTGRLPSMRSVMALYTTWKLNHERGADAGAYGEPGLLEALPIAEDLHDETTLTMAPVAVQRGLWATVGRLARALGHGGIDEMALDDAFWERHVEQPQF